MVYVFLRKLRPKIIGKEQAGISRCLFKVFCSLTINCCGEMQAVGGQQKFFLLKCFNGQAQLKTCLLSVIWLKNTVFARMTRFLASLIHAGYLVCGLGACKNVLIPYFAFDVYWCYVKIFKSNNLYIINQCCSRTIRYYRIEKR